jgi:acyl-CoA thioester hydrolase
LNQVELRVYYKDTDAGGVVYYANYLHFFEMARTEYMRKIGLPTEEYVNAGILFVVVHAELDYKSPARYGDVLFITTQVTEVKRTSFVFQHRIINQADQRLVVTGNARLCCLNEQGRVRALPPELVQKLRS